MSKAGSQSGDLPKSPPRHWPVSFDSLTVRWIVLVHSAQFAGNSSDFLDDCILALTLGDRHEKEMINSLMINEFLGVRTGSLGTKANENEN
jgi:hypothetical protein